MFISSSHHNLSSMKFGVRMEGGGTDAGQQQAVVDRVMIHFRGPVNQHRLMQKRERKHQISRLPKRIKIETG